MGVNIDHRKTDLKRTDNKKKPSENSAKGNLGYSVDMVRLENGIQILEYLDSDLRLDLVFQLILNPEISLTEITDKVGKSKATVSKHLHILHDMGFVTIREEQVRGPIKRQLFSLKENILKFICLDLENIHSIPESQKVTLYKKIVGHSNHEMNLVQRIMKLAIPFNEKLQQRIEDFGKVSEISARKLYDEYRMHNFLYALDNEEIQIYISEYKEFTKRLTERLETYRSQPDYSYHGKENVVWVGYFPIQKILRGTLDLPDETDD